MVVLFVFDCGMTMGWWLTDGCGRCSFVEGRPDRVVIYYLGSFGRAHVNKLVGEGYIPDGYQHRPQVGGEVGYLEIASGSMEELGEKFARLEVLLLREGFARCLEPGKKYSYYHSKCGGRSCLC